MRNTTERRQEVLYFISDRRRVTYQQIADEFNISYNTARNDVEVLVCSHPIIIENWRGGGVCAMDGWYASKRYLTDTRRCLGITVAGTPVALQTTRILDSKFVRTVSRTAPTSRRFIWRPLNFAPTCASSSV